MLGLVHSDIRALIRVPKDVPRMQPVRKISKISIFHENFQCLGLDRSVATYKRNKKCESASFIGFTHTFTNKRHKNHSSLK